jgi:CelD/BcsL family acetyltransferase involved in cellulose biosynthesis
VQQEAAIKSSVDTAKSSEPEIKEIPFRYRLGEIVLFASRLRLQVGRRGFLDVPKDAGEPEPPEQLPDGCHGLLLRACPVPGPQPRLARRGRYLRYIPSQYERFYADLEGTADDYLAGWSGKSRSTLRRKVRKFEKLSGGEIDFREYRTPDEVDEFYRIAREVSAKTYQERLLDSGLPTGEKFVAGMRERAARDELRAYLLFHEGKPVAYLYLPARDGMLIYAFLGFDPEYRQHSPGTVLQWLAMEKLFAEGRFQLLDFTEGEGDHKRKFSTGSRYCADVYFLRRTPGLYLRVWLQAGLDSLSRFAVGVIDRLGLKARLKRFVRNRA